MALICRDITQPWLREQPQTIVAAVDDLRELARQDELGLLEGGKRCYVTDHLLKWRLIEEGRG